MGRERGQRKFHKNANFSLIRSSLPSIFPASTLYNFRRRRARRSLPLQSIRSFGLIVRQGDERGFCKMSLASEASGFDATGNVVSLEEGCNDPDGVSLSPVNLSALALSVL